MRALMLAAGLGRRLYGGDNDELPKPLLRFGGETLLQRHIAVLCSLGVETLTLVVGHRRDEVLAEARRAAPAGFLEAVFNPRYHEGPKLSMAAGAQVLRRDDDVLFMDADVLYDPALLERLVAAAKPNCFLMDRHFQSTDDFVKVCVRDGHVTDFGKSVQEHGALIGEWPGFCKVSAQVGAELADSIDAFVRRGDIGGTYEEAFREVLLASDPGTFAAEDITGLPWVEIDYPEDLEKAREQVFPEILRRNGGAIQVGAKRGT